jgi:hypothetical protein
MREKRPAVGTFETGKRRPLRKSIRSPKYGLQKAAATKARGRRKAPRRETLALKEHAVGVGVAEIFIGLIGYRNEGSWGDLAGWRGAG